MKIKETQKAVGASPLPARTRMDWSDFKLVLAISHEGSVARACGALGVTHSTLLRKLDGIESRLETRLFERSRSGYALTPAGDEIVRAAQEFAPVALAAESRATGQDLQPSGEVRISVASIVLDHLLPPLLAQFAVQAPDVRLELVVSREHISLRRREADVAIRVSDAVPDWLVGRRVATLDFRVYGLRDQTGVEPPLRSIDDLARERRWIGLDRDARDLKFDRWLAATVPQDSVVLRVDDFSHALVMVRAGLGIALLPAFVEATAPELQPLSGPIPELRTPLWLVTHPELRHTARVMVTWRALGPALAGAIKAAGR